MTTLLRDLIDIPERVSKSDYVISLEDGIAAAERTVRQYVVTDQLVDCFDSALGLIASAVETRSSKGAYLHGSFGSGKSHFMAMLDLLLSGDDTARSKPELAPVVAKHDERLGGRRFLLVPYHMIGAASMEQAVLGGYVRHVRRLHPEASLPPVYVADGLLDNAARLREQMGNDRFFDALGNGADEGFGDLAGGWDAASFEAALAAPPDNEERDRLVSDVITSLFPSAVGAAEATAHGFVPFEQGLAAISQHAKGLGYDGVVLFLDELILWFATRMADRTFVNAEAPKVAKLVEASSAERPLPIVSFIARQRDLRDFLGPGVPGAERVSFHDTLQFFESRFDTIELADKNLAAIVEQRLLKPKNEAARQELDRAFEETAVATGRALDTLLTSDGNREMFRRLYPFNPALVDTLIAVSGYLQRERTALRLLGQLLADKRDTLAVGDLVPLGDLYDVIESGDEPFSDELKRHFNRARDLYRLRLRPMLLDEHGLDDDAAHRVGDDHPFRTDDRLVKTLLLAALVPEVEPLRGLTVRRLADLNHGTIKTPIPGQERAAVLAKVKGWGAHVGELRVEGDEQDPSVSLQLTGVDLGSILDQAREVDTEGTRRAKIRELLSGLLGVEEGGGLTPSTFTFVWRGSRRTVDVRFANIRDAADVPTSEFRPEGRPKVVIDFPFDPDPDYGPADDRARLQEIAEEVGPAPTLFWIPLFFTEQALERLGRLVVMEHVLTGDRFEGYTTHLSPQDRSEARNLLENQARMLRTQVETMLRQAYQLETPDRDGWVRTDLKPADQFVTLDPSLDVRPPTAATVRDAFTQLLDQVHAHLYPAHPAFEEEVRPADLRTALAHVQRAVQAEQWRVDVPKGDRRAVTKVLAPLKLADVGEAHLVLRRDWADHFHRKRGEYPGTPLTVEVLRRWIDEGGPTGGGITGLDERLKDLVITTYALQTNHVLSLAGARVEPSVNRLDPSVELVVVDLPDPDTYRTAVERAATLFGVVASPILSAQSVSRLSADVQQRVADRRDAARRLVARFDAAKPQLGVDDRSDRLRTARAARDLVDGLATADEGDVAALLAAADIPTSPEALARSIATAGEVAAALDATNWSLLDEVDRLPGEYGQRAAGIRQRLAEAAARDELVTPLGQALHDAQAAATSLLGDAARRQQAAETPAPADAYRDEEEPATPRPAPQSFTLREGDPAPVLKELLARADELDELTIRWRYRE